MRFVKEGGAGAVKLEGAGPTLTRVAAIVGAGIPVMGHVGLTPQSAVALGGYRVAGPHALRDALRLRDEARALEGAGCFAVVLEAIPAVVAAHITEALEIPTIGIGAGASCDGQVLVWHDLLGLTTGHVPQFVKRYADLGGVASRARGLRRGRPRADVSRSRSTPIRWPRARKSCSSSKSPTLRTAAPSKHAMQDVVYAWRMLRRSPGFTFFAVLTIALGLGANAAIFSLVDGVLLKSVGYPEPERIVQLWEKPPRGLRNGIAGANYIDWARQSQSFEAMAAQTGATMSYIASDRDAGVSGEPRVAARRRRLGAVLRGVRRSSRRSAARSRATRTSAARKRSTVLTHRLWLNLFGGDAGIVGRTILLNGEPYTVIGVLPGNSEFDRRPAELWVPLAFPPNPARDYHYLSAVARLKRGVTLEQAQAEMSAIAGAHRGALSGGQEGLGRHRRPLPRSHRRPIRRGCR